MVLTIRNSTLGKFSLVLDPTSLRVEYRRRRNKIGIFRSKKSYNDIVWIHYKVDKMVCILVRCFLYRFLHLSYSLSEHLNPT